ncbi:MAG: GNAT family N-acetyltransferase [Devosia sp.]|uniref:GNAT family N-acetyltransferase n=1 Tax=Devosia sp. TaxID=1871048 RepID=UPI001A0A47CF|nr:GNAT family N-acetyltransferase [Devosia sp.]MBF0680454.1 GNAT family N-acetyltransferase [Devosia sp.]
MARIVLEEGSSQQSHDVILNGLAQYNEIQTEGRFTASSSLVLAVKNDAGQTEGGLAARITCGWMHIDMLHIPESLRGTGIGASLMASAEELAREKACVGLRLDTTSFQAPGFYEKLGYTEFGRLENSPPGHTRYFFMKRLD